MNDNNRKAMYAKGFGNVVKLAKKHDFNKNRLEVEFASPNINYPEHIKFANSLSFPDMKTVNQHYDQIKEHGETTPHYVVGGKPFELERRQSAPLKFVKKAKSIGLHLDQYGWIDTKDKRNNKILDMYDQNYVLTRHNGELKKQ